MRAARTATRVVTARRAHPTPAALSLAARPFSTSFAARNADAPKHDGPSASSSGTSSSSSSSSTGKDEKQEKEKEKAKAKDEPPEDTTVEGRSPWTAFVQVLREEVRKNREWQESVKQLGGEVTKVQDSEAMRKTRELYERARLTASIKENPRLQAAAEELRKAGQNVNDAVVHALKGMEENPFIRSSREAIYKTASAVGNAALTASEPIRQTEAYKTIAAEITEALDDAATNVQHGGYVDKENRRRRREARLAKAGKRDMAARKLKVEEDPLAGQAVQLHATANEVKTSRFASLTPQPVADLLESWKHIYAESENPVVSAARTVGGTFGRLFAETETAKVTRMIKEMDPSFTSEAFLRELREYIVPEMVDAYVNADQATLKLWCSEATYNVVCATLGPFLSPTLVSESRVLDIRNLDIAKAKILENDLPVFVVAWQTQEILAYRDIKTGQLAQGSESKIEMVGYVAVFTRVEDEVDNKVTGGWKIIDMARRAA